MLLYLILCILAFVKTCAFPDLAQDCTVQFLIIVLIAFSNLSVVGRRGVSPFSSTTLLSFLPSPVLGTSDERISSSAIRCFSVLHTLSPNSKNSSADISILDELISLKYKSSRFNSLKTSASSVWTN